MPAKVSHIVEHGRGAWTVRQMLESAIRDIDSGETKKPAKAVLVIYDETGELTYTPVTYRCELSAFDEIAVLEIAKAKAIELARS